MTAPPTDIPGTRDLHEVRCETTAFSPCIDLKAADAVLATVFYDGKPECAYASVSRDNEHGEMAWIDAAAAGISEDEVGWCLQFTDDPRLIQVICRRPPDWEEHVLAAAWILLAARIDERGTWAPEPDFRLWSKRGEDDGGRVAA